MKVSNVKFADYNGQDNLYFEVDVNLKELLKSTPVYNNSKILYEGTRNEGTLWVKIWDCGLARFGFTQKADPLHGNQEYTWSSNAGCINNEFALIGTPYELARYGAGIKEEGDSGCFKIGEDNVEKLHWGIEQYRLTIDTTAPYVDGRDKLIMNKYRLYDSTSSLVRKFNSYKEALEFKYTFGNNQWYII